MGVYFLHESDRGAVLVELLFLKIVEDLIGNIGRKPKAADLDRLGDLEQVPVTPFFGSPDNAVFKTVPVADVEARDVPFDGRLEFEPVFLDPLAVDVLFLVIKIMDSQVQ